MYAFLCTKCVILKAVQVNCTNVPNDLEKIWFYYIEKIENVSLILFGIRFIQFYFSILILKLQSIYFRFFLVNFRVDPLSPRSFDYWIGEIGSLRAWKSFAQFFNWFAKIKCLNNFTNWTFASFSSVT